LFRLILFVLDLRGHCSPNFVASLPWLGWYERQCSIGPVLVVVGHEQIKNTRQMLLVHNQHPVETFRADRVHKPLRHSVGLRRAKRRANDRDAIASKNLVKSFRKFLVPITDQETDTFWALRQRPRPASVACSARELRVHRRDRLGGVVHEYVLAA
jgi:hypothetical protein